MILYTLITLIPLSLSLAGWYQSLILSGFLKLLQIIFTKQ